MNEELQNKLYNKYPKIFVQKDYDKSQSAMCWGISCGEGWYHILDILCMKIQTYIDQPHETLEYIEEQLSLEENQNLGRQEYFLEWKAKTEKQIISQVEAVQVKEKYGTLRFYVNGADNTIRSWISFAETMSSVTCESCGCPGKINSGRWLSVRCDSCRDLEEKERKEFLENSRQLKLKFEI